MALETFKQWGLRKAIWAACIRRLRPWFVLTRVSMRKLNPDALAGDIAGVTMRQATRDDLLAAVADNPSQLSLAFVDAALARDDFCLAAFDGAQMVAWTWASLDVAPHGDGLCVKVDPPYEYGYKSFTRPEYRGRGIISHLSLLRDKVAVERGCTHFVGFVETHNYVSVQANRRLGSRLAGYAGYVRLFGKSYPFRTPGVVQHTFRFIRA